jgi:outer membrane protein OmpA-like peptidoglycan-associated protein
MKRASTCQRHVVTTEITAVKVMLKSALPAFALLLAACATTSPQSESALAQAQTAVRTLEVDPLAAQIAGKPLQDARDSLAAAEKAQQDHKPPEDVVHLSYLARRQAQIGEAVIAEARARQQIAQAQSQRDQVLMAARERDAAMAQQQAQSAQAQAAAAQNQAAAAQSQAAAARDQVVAANDEAAQAREQLMALQAKQTERGMVLTLGSNVLFDTGSDVLKPGADDALNRVAQFMQGQSNVKIRIEGHTDSRGSASYNDSLSQRRADAVYHALVSRGVDSSRIQSVGRGMELPVASNDTAEGRQQNRRVELIFSNEQGQFASIGSAVAH